jgi:hypothetical protein
MFSLSTPSSEEQKINKRLYVGSDILVCLACYIKLRKQNKPLMLALALEENFVRLIRRSVGYALLFMPKETAKRRICLARDLRLGTISGRGHYCLF